MILEESQSNITSCLLGNPVPCTGIAEEPPTASGTNPQTLTNNQWRTQEFFSKGAQQIQLRTEDRKNGDLGAVAP